MPQLPAGTWRAALILGITLGLAADQSTFAQTPHHGSAVGWHARPGSVPEWDQAQAARPATAPHLLIQPAAPAAALPVHSETVGGGYWKTFAEGEDQQGPVLHGPVQASPPGRTERAAEHVKHAVRDKLPAQQHRMPAAPPITAAPQLMGWKQPYAYGYFGAKHNRQRSVHHGHQRSYTQWTFR